MKKQYTLEQKKEAIQMLAELGPAKTKEILGIPSPTLYRWRDMMNSKEPDEQFDGTEIPQVEARCAEELEMEESDQVTEEKQEPVQEEDIEEFHFVLDEKESYVLGGILIKLHSLEQENTQLREDNTKLRNALMALLRGETDD